MARDKLSNFLCYKFLVNFFSFCGPRSLHEPRTWRIPGLCQCPCVINPREFTSLPTHEAKYSFSGFIPTNKQTNKQMRSRDWGRKSLPGWYARPQLYSSWSAWSRLGAPAWYGHYLDWWGQKFRCVDWRQRLNRRCQWFLVTGSATAAVNSVDLSSEEIADREIKIKKR